MTSGPRSDTGGGRPPNHPYRARHRARTPRQQPKAAGSPFAELSFAEVALLLMLALRLFWVRPANRLEAILTLSACTATSFGIHIFRFLRARR